MGTPNQEASRIGMGTYKYSGGAGFASSTLLQMLVAAGFAGADLPGATALDSAAATNGKLSSDPSILTGFDMLIVAGTVYWENDTTAATANDTPVDASGPLRVRDYTMTALKALRFFCPAGAFDIRISLVG